MTSESISGCGSGKLQLYKLEVLCHGLVGLEQYLQAATQLKRLHEAQPGNIRTMLMLGKSLINLDKFDVAFEVAKELREVLLLKPRPEAREVVFEATKCLGEGEHIMSLMLLWCACAVYKEERDPKDALYDIGDCLFDMVDFGFGNGQLKQLGTEEADKQRRMRFASFLIFLMDDMVTQVKTFDVADSDLRTVMLLRCLGNKANCIAELGQHDEAIEQYLSLIDQLKALFGSNVSKMYMMGEFLESTGLCYLRKGDNETYVSYITQAQAAVKESEPLSEVEKVRKQKMESRLEEYLNPKKTRKGKFFNVFKK